jgi:hypothetical protein
VEDNKELTGVAAIYIYIYWVSLTSKHQLSNYEITKNLSSFVHIKC